MLRPLAELDQTEGAQSKIYPLYVAALERLLVNDPEDEQLEAYRDEEGKALVTQSSVSDLAGKHRKHISGERCAFPVLAAYIMSLKTDFGVRSSTTARLKRQSEDIAILVQRLKAVRSRLAESILVRDQLAAKLRMSERDLERAKGKRSNSNRSAEM